jgi:hypothetical protein
LFVRYLLLDIYLKIYRIKFVLKIAKINLIEVEIHVCSLNRIQLNNHFFLPAFLASFFPFPAGALSAASFSLAFLSA